MGSRTAWYFFSVLILQAHLLATAGEMGAMPAAPEQATNDFFDRLEALKNRAMAEVQGVKNLGKPRIVVKGARPEIIIVNEDIYFNGTKLRLGQSLTSWKKALAGHPRCTTGDGIVICVWEQYGLQVGTDDSRDRKVAFLNIHMSFYEDDGLAQYKTNGGGGNGKSAGDDWQVHQAFHGYLELDGYGIDAATEFWEIKSATENKRQWRCGLLDCASPGGTFGDHAQMQLRLEGKGERAIIRQLDIF